MSAKRRDPAVVAMIDQWEAQGRALHDELQAYIDELDRQCAWHKRWDPWLVRIVWPGIPLLLFVLGLVAWLVV